MKPPRFGVLRWAQLGIAIVLVAGLGLANYHVALRSLGGNAFLPRWEAARQWLVLGVDPYDPAVALAAQESIYGRPAEPEMGEDLAQFLYPLPAMAFYAPFAFLPHPIARAIWLTLLEISLPALALMSVRLTRWRPKPWLMAVIMLSSFFWYHGFRLVVQSDFAGIEALLVVGGLMAIQRHKDRLAGVLLALSMANLQMSWLVLLFVFVWGLANRRSQLVRWMVVSTLVMLGISLLLMPGWIMGWLRHIAAFVNTANVAPLVVVIAGVVPKATLIVSQGLAIALGLQLLWQWGSSMRRGDPWFQWTAALTITVGNFLMLPTTSSNYVLMLPGLLLIGSTWSRRWGRRGDLALALALVSLIVGLWALGLATSTGARESPLVFLPLPILTLVGLWWSRWWITLSADYSIGSASDS